MGELRECIVLVTGAPAAAGWRIAERFAKAGAWVGVSFRRDLAGAKSLVDQLRSDGGRAILLPGDAADPAQAWAIVERLDLEWGRPVIVVEQSGAEARPRGEKWPPTIDEPAAHEIAKAAWPPERRTADGLLILVGPAHPSLVAIVGHMKKLIEPVHVRGLVVAEGTTYDQAAEAVLRLALRRTPCQKT